MSRPGGEHIIFLITALRRRISSGNDKLMGKMCTFWHPSCLGLCAETRLCADTRLCAETRLCADTRLCTETILCADTRLCAEKRLCADMRWCAAP